MAGKDMLVYVNKDKPGSIANWGFEWKTETNFLGLPYIHIAMGRDRQSGKILVAKGVIAIGQLAVGLVAIGQFSVGVLFGLAQFSIGLFAIAQVAFGGIFGLGQVATGITAIGQLAIGKYVLAQAGFGEYVWSLIEKNPQALEYFRHFLQ